MIKYTELKTFLSPDGKRRLSIYARSDGMFTYGEEQEVFEDMSDVGLASFHYWSETYASGFYSTAADAERDAIATTPWLCPPTPD